MKSVTFDLPALLKFELVLHSIQDQLQNLSFLIQLPCLQFFSEAVHILVFSLVKLTLSYQLTFMKLELWVLQVYGNVLFLQKILLKLIFQHYYIYQKFMFY